MIKAHQNWPDACLRRLFARRLLKNAWKENATTQKENAMLENAEAQRVVPITSCFIKVRGGINEFLKLVWGNY